MNILADGSLPGLVTAFPSPFRLTTYSSAYEIPTLLPKQDVLLCRSTLQVNEHLIDNATLRYVATASSGTDHIDKNYMERRKIQVLDAKGSNARAVADYVVSCLAYLSNQQIALGQKAGVIGMGCVGSRVAERLKALGFQLVTYDPLKTSFKSHALEDLYACDVICIHPELHTNNDYPSFDLINHTFLDHLRPNCVLINASRGGVVNENDLLYSTKPMIYCTDVYLNEPSPNPNIIDMATLCTPHIAGHSLEAKYKAVSQISEQLHAVLGLPTPQYDKPEINSKIQLDSFPHWQDLVLSLYNPMIETHGLKKALNKESTFLTLRKEHRFRHDFIEYFDEKATESMGSVYW
jgi:erythronate-4-phosphate dehydrogenase